MAQQNLVIGTSPNDNNGESLRSGMVKIEANFTDLYTNLVSLIDGLLGSTDWRTNTGGGGGGGLTTEQVQDIVGNLIATSSTHTGITVTYNDTANTLSFALVGETFTSAEQTKLAGIEGGATADQTGSEIVASINTELGGTTWQGGGGGGGSVDAVSNVAQNTVLGRTSPGSGDSEELSASQVRSLLNVEDGATADQTGAEIVTAIDNQLGQTTWQSGGSGGTGNGNITAVTNVAGITSAGAGAYLDIQSAITLTADFTPPADQTWEFTTGSIVLDGNTLTGNNTSFIVNDDNLAINVFSGTIAGTWDPPTRIYSSNFGLIGDAEELKDGAMTSGSAVLTSATANFTSADIGKVIGVRATQSEFNPVQPSNSRGTTIGTIVSVQSATQCTLSQAATRTESGTMFRYGSDNYTAGMNALYFRNQKAGEFIFTEGIYMKTEVAYTVLAQPITRFGQVPNNWYIGMGVDDIHVRGEGATIMSLPNNLDGVHHFTLKQTHRSTVENMIFDGEFQYHNHVGNFADEAQHGLVVQTAAYNCAIKNVDIVNFTGDGRYDSGDLQFTNAIKGSAATGFPGVAQFVSGTFNDTTGAIEADATLARTDTLIDVTGFQFENTRVINPNREGDRHYQFSGSSFAGWSGLINPVYTAYYYGAGGIGDFIGVSEPREFYKTYSYPDDVSFIHLVIDMPEDLTVIDAQVRAPVDPRGTVMYNVNISDCGRHGAANLSSYTSWSNSVIENIGNTLPAFGINIEDQRRAATNYLFQNISFRDCYSGGLNLVGTVNVDVVNCKFEGTTDPGRLLHPDFMGAIGGWRGRNFKAIGNYINRGSFSVGRSGIYADNTVTYGSLAFEANGAVFRDGQLHQVVVTNVGGQSVNHRTPSTLKNTRMTYDRSMSNVFTNTNMYFNIEDVEVIANDVSRLNNDITPANYNRIILNNDNQLFNQVPAPTEDFGGTIKNLRFSGARPSQSARDFVSNNDWPVTDYYGDNNYSESSITFGYGMPMDRTIRNLTVDGWVDFALTQFEDTVVSTTPTLTFENLNLTIPEGVFDWTNTNSYIFETRVKNVNIVVKGGNFNLNVASSVIGSSNRFMRLAQLGTLVFDGVNFHSETPKTIDFTNTSVVPTNTGAITVILREEPDGTITFVPRPGVDRIIHAYLGEDNSISNLPVGTPDGSALVMFEDVTDNGIIKRAAFPTGGGSSTVDVVSNVAPNTILGRTTSGSGDSEELTAAQTRTLLNVEDGATADQTGTEIVSSINTELGGTGWQSGGGSSTVDFVSNVAQNTLLGRIDTGSGNSEELNPSDVRTLINVEDGATADQNANEVPVTATPTNYTAGSQDVEAHLAGIDTALGSAGGGVDLTSDLILDDGDNVTPVLGVSNTFSSNDYQLDMFITNASSTIRARNVTGGVSSSITFSATQLNPSVTATTDLGFTSRRYRNAYFSGIVFVSTGVSTGGDGSGFFKDNGTIDTNTYLQAPSISQYGVNRTAVIGEANGTVNFNAGAALTYTVPVDTTVNFPLGTRILIHNEGATSVTLTADTGVTFVGASNLALTNDQAVNIIHVSLNEWLVIRLNS